LKLLPILSRGWQLLQRVHRSRDYASNHGIERSRQLVVHPHTVAAGGHETALTKIRQMAGDGRLRESKAVVDVADTHLVVSKQGENAQPRFVGERFEQAFQLVDGCPAF
jgi:hypothetical protein